MAARLLFVQIKGAEAVETCVHARERPLKHRVRRLGELPATPTVLPHYAKRPPLDALVPEHQAASVETREPRGVGEPPAHLDDGHRVWAEALGGGGGPCGRRDVEARRDVQSGEGGEAPCGEQGREVHL